MAMRTKGGLRHLWSLAPETAPLNHGSFGACPRAVLDEQRHLRGLLEANPQRFFSRELLPLLDAARRRLAAFVGADPEGLVFVRNATEGVNAVLRSLRLRAADEILVTDHGYESCAVAAAAVAQRAGGRVVTARLPFPPADEGEVCRAVLGSVTPRTRLAILDHVTSPTALILPVRRLAAELESRGVEVLIDGAHAPGMLPLDLDGIGTSYYTGNCHKWLCAPKGSAFLQVRADRRAGILPAVSTHSANWPVGARTRFHNLFDWPGTHDPTAHLCVPFAIDYLGSLVPGGWDEIMRGNRAKVLLARDRLRAALPATEEAPDAFIGSMVSFLFKQPPAGFPPATGLAHPLQDLLSDRYGIEVPVMRWQGGRKVLLRVSAQLYNEPGDYERLAAALGEIFDRRGPCPS
ncbi:MAG: penicillin epimerase [Elusimicrobia bacterium GWA2_69_24]|nr:MAG: penicillin epimerase [Elusimicrobia bacterium GWA2_69_24]HBL19193.1 aminotransferase [Elusimicrobiota bacterium]